MDAFLFLFLKNKIIYFKATHKIQLNLSDLLGFLHILHEIGFGELHAMAAYLLPFNSQFQICFSQQQRHVSSILLCTDVKMKGKKDILEDLSNIVVYTFSCVYFSESLMSVSMTRFKYPLHRSKYPTLVPFTVNEEGLRHLCKPLARELTVH